VKRESKKLKVRGFIGILVLLTLLPGGVGAQDIEAVAKSPVLAMNGGISLSQIATFSPGDATAQDPYSLYLAGNMNLSLFGVVSVPLSFAYTNRELSGDMSLPFNRFSIAPSYKWVKLYAGYTSMQFSPYSLAGHELLGGGVELTPDNGWKVSALYGRLRKASAGDNGTDPSYERMGGGFKVEYKGKGWDAGVNLFKAKDLPASAIFLNPDSLPVTPQDNLTGSVTAGVELIKSLRWNTEYGFSALNRDIENTDMSVYHALKTGLAYAISASTIGATYERVAPNYTTLGAYYMTNDYENITANFSTTIRKFNISIDGGYQRDNLGDQKTNSASRMIFSGNVSANLSERLTLGANLSNVHSFVYVNDVYSQVTQTNKYQNLDTLNVTQLDYTASFNAGYLLVNTKEVRQGVNLNFMYQQSSEKQQYNDAFSGNNIYNTSLSYNYGLMPAKLNASVSVNHNYNGMPDGMFSQAFTCNLSVQKVFLEELKTGLICTYSDMHNQDGKLSNVLNLRLNAGYVFLKQHTLNFTAAMVNSTGQQATKQQYSANLAYSYTFGASLVKKNKKMEVDANF
jgi:hypothetical protein